MPTALLALEDGTTFAGESFGARGETSGEVVFNTSMTGYQEIVTDPSYTGQIVAMTYPLIGNYGVNADDVESDKPHVEGFVVKELSRIASNWRGTQTLGDWLATHGIVGIQGVDTRALTRLLRTKGALKGVLSTEDLDPARLVTKAKGSPGLVGRDLVKEVSCQKAFTWEPPNGTPAQFHVVAIDCGTKRNIFRMLTQAGCKVTVVPAATTAAQILALKPDGLFLSNGPGDPEGVPYVIEAVRQLLPTVPTFGICLGHQILGLALGGKTYKLKFGHHGGNHPVLDMTTRKVEITAQNHGFAVDVASIPGGQVTQTHLNLYDKTVEGMRHNTLPVFSVQYHPEAAPGPHDAHHLFDQFLHMMARVRGTHA
ncbi:MAG: carbamoyl phosphate synthase small subunit [Omnitrophica WOR_2 bacterium RIFCSPHIGHO2_02_FULL_68_15]|nr:MAG: carbamoyl phosphate synthase small subunit [Omnitrophica WOR_2 bacterium RIFCSPHIGHO2_02_FULL_68_15]